MMQNLRIRQEHKNFLEGKFPKKKKLSEEAIDYILAKEEKRINRGRTMCKVCNTQKSVSGSCFC